MKIRIVVAFSALHSVLWGRNRSGFDRYTRSIKARTKAMVQHQKATSHDTKVVSTVAGGLFVALDSEIF